MTMRLIILKEKFISSINHKTKVYWHTQIRHHRHGHCEISTTVRGANTSRHAYRLLRQKRKLWTGQHIREDITQFLSQIYTRLCTHRNNAAAARIVMAGYVSTCACRGCVRCERESFAYV